MCRLRYASFFGLMAMNVGLISFFEGVMAAYGKSFGLLPSLTIIVVSDACFLAGFYSYLYLSEGED